MGKLDDMRRLREQQFAEGRKRQITPPAPEPVARVAPVPPVPPARTKDEAPAPVPAKAPAPVQARSEDGPAQPTRPTRPAKAKTTTSSKSGGERDEQGKCPVCGKMKPLGNGVLTNHQKGFGKACAGSRQKPV
jgi:hypothetical protein